MTYGSPNEVLAVIPARYASTRFPGKIIAPLAGKPLVAHTYEKTCRAQLVSEVVVAADDTRILEALKPLGVPVIMTRTDHPSGTDRIAEVAASAKASIIVNVQGDEPLIDPKTIDAAIEPLLKERDLPMSTARRLITAPDDIDNANVVKVICDQRNRALYFSRSAIPCIRDAADRSASPPCYLQHF